MKTRLLILACFAVGWLFPASVAYAQKMVRETPDSAGSVSSPLDAIQSAVDYMGVSAELASAVSVSWSDSATVETYADSLAWPAFVSLNNRRVYRVTATIRFDTTKYNGEIRDFVIHIDSATSQLVRIESTLPSYHRKVASGALSERSVRELATGNTIGDCLRAGPARLPSESPDNGFLQAWKIATGGSLWTQADRVLAWFVTLNVPFRGVENVWYIETWPTLTPISAGMPVKGGTSLAREPEARGDQSMGSFKSLVSENGEWGIMTP